MAQKIGWVILLALSATLWGPLLMDWWKLWRKDDLISHGPFFLALAVGHFWLQRQSLKRWDAADGRGLALLGLSSVLLVAAFFADVSFIKYLSLLGLTAGGVWFLGGFRAFKAAMGPLGFLFFVLPWPAMLVEKVSFPLQLTSSAYAALLSGMLGLPIQRDGILLKVAPTVSGPPVYSVMVAEACSGLTSLLVLLALGYLVAYHTPVGKGLKVAMVAAMVPLALITNTIRITLILLAGANHSPKLAEWVHNNEAPFLVFMSSLVILGLRKAVMSWSDSRKTNGGAPIPMSPPPHQMETAATTEESRVEVTTRV